MENRLVWSFLFLVVGFLVVVNHGFPLEDSNEDLDEIMTDFEDSDLDMMREKRDAKNETLQENDGLLPDLDLSKVPDPPSDVKTVPEISTPDLQEPVQSLAVPQVSFMKSKAPLAGNVLGKAIP